MICAQASSLATLSSLVVILASGCVIDDVDPTNRRCPCVAGWICDGTSDRCVVAPSTDGGDALPDDADVLVDAYVPVEAPPPPPFCATVPGAIFCDDFESGDLSRWTTVEPPAGGSVTVIASAARSGTRGVRLSAPPGTAIARLAAAMETDDDDELYFRAWVRVTDRTAGTLDIFELSAGSEGSVSAQLLPDPKRFHVRAQHTGSSGVSDDGRDGRWRIPEWNCVRGRVVRSDVGGSVEIFDSGPHQARLGPLDTDWGRPYDVFAIRLGASEAGSQVDLDDIVWTRTPLSCR